MDDEGPGRIEVRREGMAGGPGLAFRRPPVLVAGPIVVVLSSRAPRARDRVDDCGRGGLARPRPGPGQEGERLRAARGRC